MHRPAKDEWELPGGSVEDDEPLEVAAARQMFEELGIDVEIDQDLGGTSVDDSGDSHEFHWFKANIVQGEPAPMEKNECDEVRYFSKTELADMDNLSTTLLQLLSDRRGRVND
jgi:8-oxo-dGTP diphosphatase